MRRFLGHRWWFMNAYFMLWNYFFAFERINIHNNNFASAMALRRHKIYQLRFIITAFELNDNAGVNIRTQNALHVDFSIVAIWVMNKVKSFSNVYATSVDERKENYSNETKQQRALYSNFVSVCFLYLLFCWYFDYFIFTIKNMRSYSNELLLAFWVGE